MKKILIALLILTTALIMGCGKDEPINYKELPDDSVDLYKYERVDGGYEVVGTYDERENVIIPTKYKRKKVVGIGEKAFFDNDVVKNVTLPEGIKYLGYKAFKDCKMLEEINLPSTLEEIREDVFYNCHNLKYETYEGCAYIDNWLMHKVDSEIMILNIREGTVGINSFAVYNSLDLRSVNLPTSLKYIGSHAFSRCVYLRVVNLGENIEFIGQYAFAENSLMREIYIPENVERIDANAFKDCKKCVITLERKKAPSGFSDGWNGACEVKYGG